MFSFAFHDRPPDGVAWLFLASMLEECLRAAGESRRGRAHHPLASVGSAEEHWARGVLLRWRRCYKKACEESIPLDPCGLGAVPRIPSSLAVALVKGSVLFFVARLPQDRENYHAGGNLFVPFDGFASVTLCNLYLH